MDDDTRDPMLAKAHDAFAKADAQMMTFQTQTEASIAALQDDLSHASGELDAASEEIGAAALEANADIDDAVLELLGERESE